MLDTNTLLVIGIILLAMIAFRPTAAAAAPAPVPAPAPAPQVFVMPSRGDDRYTRAPEPLRQDGIPLPSIRTRGEPDPYQQMGTLTVDGKVLPLYGRRTAPRSDRFNYYTRTDTYNPVQLPLNHKRRDCQDMVGCEELFSGDEVAVPTTGEKAKVALYGFGF
jgi:hypothetical protein